MVGTPPPKKKLIKSSKNIITNKKENISVNDK